MAPGVGAHTSLPSRSSTLPRIPGSSTTTSPIGCFAIAPPSAVGSVLVSGRARASIISCGDGHLRLRRLPGDVHTRARRDLRRPRRRRRRRRRPPARSRLPLDRRRARARRACQGARRTHAPRRRRHPRRRRRRPAGVDAEHARRGCSPTPCSPAPIGAAYERAAPARPSAGHGPAAVARRWPARRRCSACRGSSSTGGRGSSPASAGRRSCGCSTPGRCRRRPSIDSTVRILGVIASPRDLAAARRRRASARRVEQAVAEVRELGRVQLDWLEPATPRRPARGAARRQLPRRCTTSATATSRRTATASCTSRTRDGRSSAVDETLFANLLSDQDQLRLVVLNSCEGARTTLTDPYAGVATTLDRPRRAGRRGDAVRDQRPGGDRLRRGAVHQPDRPPGPDRRRRRRGPQGDLQPRSTRSSGRRRCCSSATRTSSCSASGCRPRRCRRRRRRDADGRPTAPTSRRPPLAAWRRRRRRRRLVAVAGRRRRRRRRGRRCSC